MRITVLCTERKHPVVCYIQRWISEISMKGHLVNLVFDRSELSEGDILFLVSCSQIVRYTDRIKYKVTLVLHSSDLPKRRGWSPHVWSILGGESLITLALLEAAEPVDSGLIWLKTTFILEGHELFDEINNKLFQAELYLMSEAIEKFSLIKPTQQIGEPGEYMRKRGYEDSRIDPTKSISEQFNLLRVADPERYPAFFDYLGKRYLIRIEKEKSE